MTIEEHFGPTLAVGGHDADLSKRLFGHLTAFNLAVTGTARQDALTVKVLDEDNELLGGLAAYIWDGLCGIQMLWVREDRRGNGWGSRILRAAESEAKTRGCDRFAVSSFTFQAPEFYRRHGYVETGRTLGMPGGHVEVHLFKSLTGHLLT